jgi:sigma-B regulation protein RsbU (phosphoserine phosphatase)
VQQRVLPRTFPTLVGFQIGARNAPARQVGGDFYDVITLNHTPDSNRVGLAIADVSDKGMPAALYMALTRSLLRAEAERTFSPFQVLSNVNRLLLELGEQEDMFVTVFYAVLDCSTHRLTYARAGHDKPVLLHEGKAIELQGTGIALGLLEPEAFYLTEEAVDLAPGDRLVLYTDGLCDVLQSNDEMFDRRRFVSLLQKYHKLAPEALCREIFFWLEEFREGTDQYDDMTLLVLGVDESDK